MSFAHWLNPTSPSTAVFEEDVLRAVRDVDLDYCSAVLEGSPRGLDYAFAWRSTPQGFNHWSARSLLLEEMDQDDIDFIEGLMRVHA